MRLKVIGLTSKEAELAGVSIRAGVFFTYKQAMDVIEELGEIRGGTSPLLLDLRDAISRGLNAKD
jgi:hypothetical protein